MQYCECSYKRVSYQASGRLSVPPLSLPLCVCLIGPIHIDLWKRHHKSLNESCLQQIYPVFWPPASEVLNSVCLPAGVFSLIPSKAAYCILWSKPKTRPAGLLHTSLRELQDGGSTETANRLSRPSLLLLLTSTHQTQSGTCVSVFPPETGQPARWCDTLLIPIMKFSCHLLAQAHFLNTFSVFYWTNLKTVTSTVPSLALTICKY